MLDIWCEIWKCARSHPYYTTSDINNNNKVCLSSNLSQNKEPNENNNNIVNEFNKIVEYNNSTFYIYINHNTAIRTLIISNKLIKKEFNYLKNTRFF